LTFSDLVKAQKRVFGSKEVTVDVLERLQRPLVVTNGCFDLVHEGHLSLLRHCKALAGSTHDVVVALNSDRSVQTLKGSARPIRPQGARVALLNQMEQVDWIVVFDEETPVDLLQRLRPDWLVKGGDYTVDQVLGREFVKKVEIVPITHQISSTKILETMRQSTHGIT
jgi:D-beta-D-heptose 7-phosphate kinase/D-beta-D-heptose 1-phosphate adenosyltransferase